MLSKESRTNLCTIFEFILYGSINTQVAADFSIHMRLLRIDASC